MCRAVGAGVVPLPVARLCRMRRAVPLPVARLWVAVGLGKPLRSWWRVVAMAVEALVEAVWVSALWCLD